jgi:hypothetical protein
MYKEAGLISGGGALAKEVGSVLRSSGNATKDYMKIMAVPLALGIGFTAVNKLIQMRGNAQMNRQADSVFKGLQRSSDIIKENPEAAMEAFDTLKSFAPALAAKPAVARTFIEHTVNSGGRMAPDTVNLLAETQNKIQELSGDERGNFFTGMKDPLAAFNIKMHNPGHRS